MGALAGIGCRADGSTWARQQRDARTLTGKAIAG